jgi:hypothetical protein
MTFMARDQTMWRLLMDPRQDPFAQLAAQWHGLPQSQVLSWPQCKHYVLHQLAQASCRRSSS